MVKYRIPDLARHLSDIGFDPSLLGFQWLVCFLSYNLTTDISIKVLDLFLLKGSKTIFRFALGLLHLMKAEILKA